MRKITRRAFLTGTGAAVAGAALARRRAFLSDASVSVPLDANQAAALAVLGRSVLRRPDSLPNPCAAPGTPDPTLANIEQIVVCMMENHSYDNLFGCLPRARAVGIGGRATLDGLSMSYPNGDSGLVWNPYGVSNHNPYTDNTVLNSFQMPGTTQLSSYPSQEWAASHEQYDGGTCQGFALSPSGPVAMGYWGQGFGQGYPEPSNRYGQQIAGLPFEYALAQTFPVCDRWFCDVLGQTDPNRRYLIAGTSMGLTDDVGESAGNAEQDLLLVTPANGTIFDRLSAFGVTWTNYTAEYPLGATPELYPVDDAVLEETHYKPVDANSTSSTPYPPTASSTFFEDCANGSLPQFSLIDMNYDTQSQENPQDISVGEAFLRTVVEAIINSPQWLTTLLVITYDEHGGYYDHVPPPVALAPDAVPPVVQPGESLYDGFCRYGFRVPALVVSPYAIENGVTHRVHDHTSILAFVERKWNLPAMTYRDANANDLTDFLDLQALQGGKPTLASPGPFPAAGPSVAPADLTSLIPPPQAVS